MSYLARPNGTHALTCDVPTCKSELLAPTQAELFEDANLLGWVDQQLGNVCPDCTRGIATGHTMLKVALGGQVPTTVVPAAVRAGDPVFDENGVQVATYKFDAPAGATVELEPYLAVQPTVQVSDKYAAILGREPSSPDPNGTSTVPAPPSSQTPEPLDDLFDGFGDAPVDPPRPRTDPGRQTPPREPTVREKLAALFPATRDPRAAVRAPQGLPTAKGKMSAPAGTEGGAGIVKAPPRPTPDQVRKAQAAAAATPGPKAGIDVDKLAETHSLFGFLDVDTGWTPDDK